MTRRTTTKRILIAGVVMLLLSVCCAWSSILDAIRWSLLLLLVLGTTFYVGQTLTRALHATAPSLSPSYWWPLTWFTGSDCPCNAPSSCVRIVSTADGQWANVDAVFGWVVKRQDDGAYLCSVARPWQVSAESENTTWFVEWSNGTRWPCAWVGQCAELDLAVFYLPFRSQPKSSADRLQALPWSTAVCKDKSNMSPLRRNGWTLDMRGQCTPVRLDVFSRHLIEAQVQTPGTLQNNPHLSTQVVHLGLGAPVLDVDGYTLAVLTHRSRVSADGERIIYQVCPAQAVRRVVDSIVNAHVRGDIASCTFLCGSIGTLRIDDGFVQEIDERVCAELRVGDRVLSLGGETFSDFVDCQHSVRLHAPGTRIACSLVRPLRNQMVILMSVDWILV